MTATVMGGLGSASVVTESGATVGALVAVNAFGAVCGASGHFWAGAFEVGDEFGGLGPSPERIAAHTPRRKPGPVSPRANTTIAIVATDATLDKAGARRLAEVAHGGLARAIVPAHTGFDGDLIFAVATGAHPAPDALAEVALGHAAALCLARAIARGVHAARPMPGNLLPCWRERPAA